MDITEFPLGVSENQLVDFRDFVTNIPVGACKFLMDGIYTLIYGNRCFYDIFGYTEQQMRAELHDELSRALLAADHGAVDEQLTSQFHSGTSSFRIEHRITRRDGEIIWVLVSGYFTAYQGVPAVYGVVVDITDRKKMEERLRIDEERFRLALAQTDNTIFDYDIAAKVMIHADKAAEVYGLAYETHNVPDFLVEEKTIHPDSAEVFLEMYRQIREGAPTASCIVQARMIDGHYVWRKITMTNIFDQNGKPVRAVGMLEDIDEQRRREESLLERSRRDALTGLYNKITTENSIRMLLNNGNPSGVLFIADIDSFKGVNDHYGHLFGDYVLAQSAHRIARLCRHEDIIGRIGGDEFLFYLAGAFTGEAALHKAEEFCAAFVEKFSYNGIVMDVTCTVGLALCPADGDTFELLYQKADIALYQAKRKGKNRCSLFDANSSGNGEWVPYSNTEIDEPISGLDLPC